MSTSCPVNENILRPDKSSELVNVCGARPPLTGVFPTAKIAVPPALSIKLPVFKFVPVITNLLVAAAVGLYPPTVIVPLIVSVLLFPS